MEYITVKTQFILSSVLGVIFSGLGGNDSLLQILIGFVVIDYLSGVAVGIKNKSLSSGVGFYGIIKKIFIFSVVYMAHLADVATGTETIRNIAVLFYISNEGISILENLGKIGVKYPQKIKDILVQIGDEKDENSTDTKQDN
ncbi:MAG: phage holin family protein [Clostridia bacterium]|nr:phage holin family protein [Clostridia bacterium]